MRLLNPKIYILLALSLSMAVSLFPKSISVAQENCETVLGLDAEKGDVISDFLINDSSNSILEVSMIFDRTEVEADPESANMTVTALLFPGLSTIGILSDFASICRLRLNDFKVGDCEDDSDPLIATVQTTKSQFLSKLVFTVPLTKLIPSVLDSTEDTDEIISALHAIVLLNLNFSITIKTGDTATITYNAKTKVQQ